MIPPRWVLLAAAILQQGCTSVDYLLHTASGHLAIYAARTPLERVIADPATPPDLARRLQQVREIRRFAAEELALPADGSYRHYVDIARDYVVWSVTAAPALSLEPRPWCYPLVGCLSYRGYFDLEKAASVAAALRDDGLDVYVAPVQAYSTLGWFEDPVLNTLVRGPSWYTASVLFHELAHQRVYVAGDTGFNEAYAVAVQEEGERRWLRARGNDAERASFARFQEARAAFLALVRTTREELRAIYASDRERSAKLAAKSRALDALRARYAALPMRLQGYRGFDRWFAQDLNNAKLALVSTYNALVPRFAALLASVDGDMAAFHAQVARISALEFDERRRALPASR